MKATIGWTLGLLLAVGEPLTAPAFAQLAMSQHPSHVSVLERRAALMVVDVPLATALLRLSESSGVIIVFSPSLVSEVERDVTCACADITVAEALNRILGSTNFVHSELRGQIVITLRVSQGHEPSVSTLGTSYQSSGPLDVSSNKTALARVVDAGIVAHQPAELREPQSEIGGTVLGTHSNPLEGARVAVVGGPEATTDARGRFRIGNLSGAEVTLRIVKIGFSPVTQTVRVGDLAIRIVLTESVINLEAMVVTGTADATEKRALGNSVGLVSVSDVVETRRPDKVQAVLSSVPGVQLLRASGQVGGGGRTRIRGAASLSLTNEPLIYVDGVRVNNTAYAPTGSFGTSPSRINDLNLEEIESIEVLKGPSAATLYGTEASNGVIQIITKRGRQGRPTSEVHLSTGANWLMSPESVFPPNYYIGRDGQVHEFRVLEKNRELGYPSPFSTGRPYGAGASLSGGDELHYYFATDANRDEGAVTYNWRNYGSIRANLSYVTPSGKLGVDASLGALRSKVSWSGFQAVTAGIIYACAFPWCEPDPANPTTTGWNNGSRGFYQYRPEDYDHAFAYDNVDRTTVSLKLTHTPFPWLRQHVTVGPDLVHTNATRLVEKDATGRNPFFASSRGNKVDTDQGSTYFTLDYGISADRQFGTQLVATTSAGAQYYSKEFSTLSGTGTGFAIPGGSDITGSATRQVSESYLQNKTLGVFAQQQLAWNNRLFVTAALRADNNSAFGKNFNAAYYPKFSASWVVSDEPFFAKVPTLSQLRVRAAWGRAGQQPDVFSAVQDFAAKVGRGGAAGVSPLDFGNPNLKPEVGEEFEAGLDVAMFNGRAGIEFTSYNKNLKDAILAVPLKPSGGFPGNQFVNIGKVRNRGIELGLSARALEAPNVALDFKTTLATNDSKIVDLGGRPPLVVGSLGTQWFHVEGFPPGSIFYKNVVSSTMGTTTVGSATIPIGRNPMCEGGTDLGLGDGTAVPCTTAPRIYRGRPFPSWSGSFNTTLTAWKRYRFYGLVDYQGGSLIQSADIASSQMFFYETKALLDGSDPVLSGYLGNYLLNGDVGTAFATGLIKGGFARLRTVSATYDLPDRILRPLGAARGSVSVSGENLATLWREQREVFGRKLIDPEINSGTLGEFSVFEGDDFPQLARFMTTIRLTF